MEKKFKESTYAVEVMNESEMAEVNGGLLIELVLGLFAIGYQIGKDCAEADRRNA